MSATSPPRPNANVEPYLRRFRRAKGTGEAVIDFLKAFDDAAS